MKPLPRHDTQRGDHTVLVLVKKLLLGMRSSVVAMSLDLTKKTSYSFSMDPILLWTISITTSTVVTD
ncbi:hypothetical protein DSUL_20192 [Desulfovibrionales bacterium]